MEVDQGISIADRQNAARKSPALAEAVQEPIRLFEAARSEPSLLARRMDRRCGPAAEREENGEGQTGERSPRRKAGEHARASLTRAIDSLEAARVPPHPGGLLPATADA